MTRTRTITIPEIKSLADVLLVDVVGTLADIAPEHSHKVWMAAKCMQAMTRSFNSGDVVTVP